MIKSMIVAFAAVFFASGAALAGDDALTTDQAKRFVESLPSLEALGKELEAEGKNDVVMIDNTPKAGQKFKPYSRVVASLKENHTADYARLNKTVKAHGFKAEEWGAVGDRVMVAWMALKMAEEDPRAMAMMEGMDRSMLDMMPPEMKAQMETAFVMMETVRSAPEADKAAVAPVKPVLDEYMETSGQS